jgi:arginyl-tRNA--protein-N-Asp/Glu arginylyltransferase
MSTFNLSPSTTLEQNYALGLLPQRNDKQKFYSDSSCRSNLSIFNLSSENRRILRKINGFSYSNQELNNFDFNLNTQQQIFSWIKQLGWDFPISSVKLIFRSHIFNQVYVWKQDEQVVAYAICLFTDSISHIAYVFYDPKFSHDDLPIGMVLQFIIDSHSKNLDFAYLGRFSSTVGYYKRNLPGFEYFENNQWLKYQKHSP